MPLQAITIFQGLHQMHEILRSFLYVKLRKFTHEIGLDADVYKRYVVLRGWFLRVTMRQLQSVWFVVSKTPSFARIMMMSFEY